MSPIDHYLWIGSRLARSPNPGFDAKWYLKRYPEVLDKGIDPAIHYLIWGRLEGRKIRKVGHDTPTFEISGRRRYVARKIEEWDADREAAFLRWVASRHALASDLYDAISVSIVMPTYNRGYCIRHAIDSVLAQSHQKWTLIVSDDGSDDDTSNIIAGIGDERVTYLQGARRGVSAARNAALARSTGKYVFYLDSDNSWNVDYLRNMIVFMEEGQLDAAYSGSSCSAGGGTMYARGDDFDWAACHELNYVDMNAFAHRASLAARYRKFDESLRRLVDWDLILRYTRERRTAFAPFIGVHYDDQPRGDRITSTEYRTSDQLQRAFDRIRAKHGVGASTRDASIRPLAESIMDGSDVSAAVSDEASISESEKMRIGYVLWDWPALSQTFVVNELRALVERGFDIRVYYKVHADQVAEIDFRIDAHQINDVDDLERLCRLHGRTVLHSPFVYPAATLMTWPAAERLGIPFTLMAGGVDVAHYENMKRNRVGEMASSGLCLGVITLGSFHRDLLIECGVPSRKIAMERQTVDLPRRITSARSAGARPKVVCVARFIEKKGIEHLIRAARLLGDVDVCIHGYGPLEGAYRQLIDELQVGNVEIAGTLATQADLFAVYASADVFVLPCVRAANGDLDGLPTVLLEAMAAGVPVVTSRIANSPDLIVDGVTGFLAEPGDHIELAAAVGRCLSMTAGERARLTTAAHRRAVGYAGSDRTIDTLITRWTRRRIDIVLVTYDVPGYANVADTLEIIRRIYDYTVMDFDLFVVDNNSSPDFLAAIKEAYGDRANFHLSELDQNIYCGPASNRGFAEGSAEYIVYICSKEGFILRHGWDLHMLRTMDANPLAAMGGYLVELPKYRNGLEIQEYPSFPSWRSQDFARNNPTRRFRHVQGGLYILRREAYERVGGFSDTVVHNGMDVEYSHYLESQGYELVNITGVYAVTNKTLPKLGSLLDEHAYIVHPSTVADVPQLDRVAERKAKYCNLCGWQGERFALHAGCESCPVCGANAFDRSAYRILSQTGHLQTRPAVVGVVRTASMDQALATLCPRRRFDHIMDDTPISISQGLTGASAAGVFLVDHAAWADSLEQVPLLARQLVDYASAGGIALLAEPDSTRVADALLPMLRSSPIGVRRVNLISDACRFDTKEIYVVYAGHLADDLQGLDA